MLPFPPAMSRLRALLLLALVAVAAGLPAALRAQAPAADSAAAAARLATSDSAIAARVALLPRRNRALGEMLERFLARPIANGGMVRAIMDSTNARPDVTVTLGPRVVPWLTGSDLPQAAKSLLLGGYLAGNVLAQLQAKRDQDMPMAGIEGTLHVYARLRRMSSIPEVPRLEEWSALQAAGSLAAHVDSLARSR